MSKKNLFLLVSIFLFFSAFNALIILNNSTPLVYDESEYFVNSYEYYKLLKNVFNVGLVTTINNAININRVYLTFPPLFPFSISFAHFIPGFNQHLFPLVNLFYLGLLTLLIYKIGAALKNKSAGLLAAFITLSSPAIFAFSRTLFLDLAFTAIVILNFYIAIKIAREYSLKNVIFLGIATGSGILCKYTFFIYIPIFTAIVLVSSPNKKKMLNTAAYAFVSLLVVSPYLFIYLLNKGVLSNLGDRYNPLINPKYNLQFFYEIRGILHYFKKLFIYLQALRKYQIGDLYFFLLIPSLVFFIFNKFKDISLTVKAAILSWLIIAYLIIVALPFHVYPVPSPRHIMPLIPCMALLISFSVMSLKKAKIKYVVCCIIIIFSTINFLLMSFRNSFYPQREDLSTAEIFGERWNFGLVSPYTVDLKEKAIFEAIKRFGPEIVLIPDTPHPALILALTSQNIINGRNLQMVYYDFYMLKSAEEAFSAIEKALADSRCVVYIRSHVIFRNEGIFPTYNPRIHSFLNKTFESQKASFILYEEFVLSDKDVYIYIRPDKKESVSSK